jgi:phosphoribosylformimino-5-aminoimidazole carboxamide ribotide isomerase
MLLIPAIDLHEGKCVQLKRGLLDSVSVYSDDPASMARHWVDQGARRIHVVDLDGAFKGKPVNLHLVEKIVEAAGTVPVQVGGGIRNQEVFKSYIEVGVRQVIVGTQAVEDQSFLESLSQVYPRRVILGLDARGDLVATRGWDTDTSVGINDLLGHIEGLRLHSIVYTDIERDGMLSGVNVDRTIKVAQTTQIPVIASGGIKSLDDLRALKKVNLQGKDLFGVISGSALYERTLDFQAGQLLLDDGS